MILRPSMPTSCILISIILSVNGCDQPPRTESNGSNVPTRHPHTQAVIEMILTMQKAGYRPSVPSHRGDVFPQDPIGWLGPWHVDVPNDDPFQVEWRLTSFDPESTEQYHSFLSAEYDGRFDDSLISVLLDEWERMGPAGLPQEVIERGRQLAHRAALQFADEHPDQSIRQFTLDDEGSRKEITPCVSSFLTAKDSPMRTAYRLRTHGPYSYSLGQRNSPLLPDFALRRTSS